MTRISYRLASIELNDIVTRTFNSENVIRINLTQKPNKKTEEYLLKNVEALQNINHEFIIDDPSGKIEKISMTLRKVIKKPTLANFFNLDNNAPKKKANDHTVDHYIGENRENRANNVVCEYIVPRHSLVGYCIINLKEVEKGVNNSLRIELLSRINEQVIGYVNLELYIWNSPSRLYSQKKTEQISNQPILFIDPGCPDVTPNPVYNQLKLQY